MQCWPQVTQAKVLEVVMRRGGGHLHCSDCTGAAEVVSVDRVFI